MSLMPQLCRSVVIAVAIAGLADPVCGQADRDLRISKDDFELHCQELELSPAQREAAEQVYAEYSRELADAVEMSRRLGRWRRGLTSDGHYWFEGETSRDFADALDAGRAALESVYQAGLNSLDAKYFNELRRIAPGWDEKIAALERKELRDRMLNPTSQVRSLSEWDLVDVIAVVHDGQPHGWASAQVEGVLREYELDMDAALHDFEAYLLAERTQRSSLGDRLAAAKIAGEDIEPMIAAIVEERLRPAQLRKRISDLHFAAATALRPLIANETFHDSLHRRLHSYLYDGGTPDVALAYRAAAARLDAMPVERAALESIWQQWRGHRDAMTLRLRETNHDRSSGSREFEELRLRGRPQEAMALYEVRREAWNQALEGWRARCAETCEKIAEVVQAAALEPSAPEAVSP